MGLERPETDVRDGVGIGQVCRLRSCKETCRAERGLLASVAEIGRQTPVVVVGRPLASC